MHSDDLRPVGPRTWALLSGEARAALEAFNPQPAPFEIDGFETPTATIIQWNDPGRTRQRDRAYSVKYREAKRAASGSTTVSEARTPPAPTLSPFPQPLRKPNIDLAKQLIGLTKVSSSKIADLCRMPIEEVEALRANGEQGA